MEGAFSCTQEFSHPDTSWAQDQLLQKEESNSGQAHLL